MAPHVTTIILLYDFTTLLALILKHILIHQLSFNPMLHECVSHILYKY